MKRITFEEVRDAFTVGGCTLLSTEYVKAKDKLRYICNCGNEAEIAYDKFRSGQRCSKCKGERVGRLTRKTYEEVCEIFKTSGCELLTPYYTDNKQKLEYRCNCGNIAEIALAKFNAGQRCSKCKGRRISERQRGKFHHGYKHDRTDEQRIKDRKYPEYLAWRAAVYDRDEYTCVNCNERGGTIVAHHIYSYAKYPERRTQMDNGITMCQECHKRFHRAFSNNRFEPEDTRLFLAGILDECPY